MTVNTRTREQALTQLLSVARDRGFGVSGNPEVGWIIISSLVLGEAFNKPVTPAIVKFAADGSGPEILLPAIVELKPDCQVCTRLLNEVGPTDLWHPLCPHIFHDVGSQVVEFIVHLAGLLANPCLCGLLDCPVRDRTKPVQRNPQVRVHSWDRAHDER